jgi:hypothetical protein
MVLCCIADCDREAKAKDLCNLHYDRMRNGRSLIAPVRSVIRGTDEQRFKAKVRVNPETECWEWAASRNTSGYGQFRFRGMAELAHRVSWVLFRGEIPQNDTAYRTVNVLHRCDNIICVNPEHLFLGDQADNANDSVSKGRWGRRGCKGEAHGRVVLTEEAVRKIRASKDTVKVIATKFGISKSNVRHIRKRRSWTHI